MAEHTVSVRVRWSEADPAGIVFYPRFFEWYDLGAAALFEAVGLPWPEIFPREDLSPGASDLGWPDGLRQGLRGPSLGRASRFARRPAAGEAHPRGGCEPAQGIVRAMKPGVACPRASIP
jgi:hypothetical protein